MNPDGVIRRSRARDLRVHGLKGAFVTQCIAGYRTVQLPPRAEPAGHFVFTTGTGLPLHHGDFYTHVWRKLMKALPAEGRGVNVLLAGFICNTLEERRVTRLDPPRNVTTTTDPGAAAQRAGGTRYGAMIRNA